MNRFNVFAFTHHTIGLDAIGSLHVEEDAQAERLEALRSTFDLSEIMVISTCNRVEFLFVGDLFWTNENVNSFFQVAYPNRDAGFYQWATEAVTKYMGSAAAEHLFQVSASLDSLVVGEREIITQVRNAYERARQGEFAGDFLRIVIRKAIETAKAVYTRTEIANKPVSVVNLAYRELRELRNLTESRILVVGAGQTNAAMVRNLRKAGCTGNITVFNRTERKAKDLAETVAGEGFGLEALHTYSDGFDVLLTCTGSTDPVITTSIYEQLLAGETDQKMIVDLAVPQDTEEAILDKYPVNWIGVTALQGVAQKNLELRKQELVHCEQIIQEALADFDEVFHARKVELAMSQVPRKVKEIRQTAVEEVFAKDLATLDDESKAVVEKMMAYMEKKYISVPMKLAKEIMLGRA